MFVVLKIVHLLCLAVALGMTSANLIMMRYVKSVDPAARQEFGPLGRSFGAFGVMAIALLWITGIALTFTVGRAFFFSGIQVVGIVVDSLRICQAACP